jgi:ATP-dependent Lon protease
MGEPKKKEEPEQTEAQPEEERIPDVLPLLPVRDAVYFPHMIFPLVVGRDKSVRALDDAVAHGRYILLVAQKEMGIDEPGPEDIYSVGVAAEVMQMLKVPDGTVRVMLEGLARVRLMEFVQSEPLFRVRVEPIPEVQVQNVEMEALTRSVSSQFEQVVHLGRQIPAEALLNIISIDDPGRLADTVTPYLPIKVEQKQEILETFAPRKRLEKLSAILRREIEILEIQKNIRSRVEKEMGESQREYLLREQMKAIQQELGERDERTTEIQDYKQKIEAAKMPEAVRERAEKELERLEKMPYAAPEGVVVRTYLDWLVTLPWGVATKERLDIGEAQRVLDEDHYGLRQVKDRMLEFLAVRKLAGALKGPILCFAGPPGVGKTSIGRSIARALGRNFIRISLGGIRDEAEIRGHRRTYIGALPGRIIQGIKSAGSRNPVFMLDEIDKLGMDFRGDPSSALLEALDPEQNDQFSDHYLEVPFDLRDVMFITTANILDPVPPALRDRMEVIPFPGYIEDEKLAIAEQFLIPKQLGEHGLIPPPKNDQPVPRRRSVKSKYVVFESEAIREIIRRYTREAGVRNLERSIATICRKVAKGVARGRKQQVEVTPQNLKRFLGQERFTYGVAEERDEVGTATGLVYTEVGGDTVSVEISRMDASKPALQLTGQLGDVMRESAQAALTFVRSRAAHLGIPTDFFEKSEIHIHVPAGAVPKDGPSAGITMATAIASALTGRSVRKDVAMTGEITLRGKVLPVGGLKEKILAAHRAGIRTVILPRENRKDLDDVPANVKRDLSFKYVENMDQVLRVALGGGPKATATAKTGTTAKDAKSAKTRTTAKSAKTRTTAKGAKTKGIARGTRASKRVQKKKPNKRAANRKASNRK